MIFTSFLAKIRTRVPAGAASLFSIQLFCNLGYSVLYSTLVLYATQGLKINDVTATTLTGSFVALNYFLHLLGGYMGGRYFSYRTLFLLGILLQVIGSLFIAVPHVAYLLWGLAIFLSGSGLNVTCINCMVTQLFEPHDKRREAVFLWNYSGMNLSFFVGFAIGGYFQLTQHYQELFILAAIGNFLACVLTVYYWKSMYDRNTLYSQFSGEKKRLYQSLGLVGIVILILLLRLLLSYANICNDIVIVIGLCIGVFWFLIACKEKEAIVRNKIWAYILLALSSLTFWALYQLAPMGLNLFIERNVDAHLFGFSIAPQWTQNINSIVIIFGGPLLSFVFSRLRERGKDMSLALQFAIALLLIGAGMLVLPIGISFANPAGFTRYHWVMISYFLQSIGELFISPIGYAMIGQLAPMNLRGIMMGTWMMIIGIAAILSDHFSKLMLGDIHTTNPLVTNENFSHTFNELGLSAVAIGIVLLCLMRLIGRLTGERQNHPPQ